MKVTWQTTSARPIVDRDGNESSEVFRAGQTYDIPDGHPHLKYWLANNFCFAADSKPKGPPTPLGTVATAVDERIVETVEDTIKSQPGWRRPRGKQGGEGNGNG